MSVQPYPDDQIKRFGEFAELFLRCRAAWREVTIETEGYPGPGSLAARDRQEVAEHLAPGRPRAALVIPSAVQRYMLAASEQFGGLAALYQAEEVLYSPANLARSLIEHCASAAWVLGTDGEPVANRLARAYREELKSAEEAKKNAGRLLGKSHPEYLRMAEGFKRCSEEIEEVFPGGWSMDENGHRLLYEQRLPGLEESVTWLLSEFLSRPQSPDVGRGTYGYISNMAHPTLYRISGLWAVEERDGKRVPVLDVGIEDHEKQAQLIVSPYYELLACVMTYHGWPRVRYRELTHAIDRLLPDLLPAEQ
ncbi:MAG: hypothetical protein WBQ21_06950 [Solirubrobacteraceae bacterium]